MEIRIECPACKTVYHLNETMLGKSMRCPLPSCRHVFKVEKPQPPELGGLPLLPSEPAERSGLPLLPSEPAVPAPAEPKSGPKAPNWASAPPPVRVPLSESKAAELGGASEQEPTVLAAGSWQAPPPRRPEAQTNPLAAHLESPSRASRASHATKTAPDSTEVETPDARNTSDEVETPDASETFEQTDRPYAVAPAKGRIARLIILPFLGLVLAGLGVGAFLVLNAIKNSEMRLSASADADYDKSLFGAAGQKYAKLAKDFPESEQVERYQFRAKLSELRNRAAAPSDDLNDKLQAFKEFLEEYAKKPILQEHAADLGDSLVQMLVSHAKSGLEDPLDGTVLTDLEKAETVTRMVRAIKAPKESRPVAWVDLERATEELRAARQKAEDRRRLLTNLEMLARSPTYTNILLAETMLAEEGGQFPGLSDSPKVKEIFENLYNAHRASIQYVPRGKEAGRSAALEEDSSPALLVGPLLAGSPGNAPANDPVVLALSRGVLYGLSERTGRIRWARRLGIDTTSLPLRIPAGKGSSERILALSSDSARLDALDPDGNLLWTYPLGTPSLGRPLVVGQRAYLATYDGEVHEIELNEGRLLGRFVLNHRLTTGGAHDPTTGLLYFPADDGCIYILRGGANPGCEQILYTRHLAASLRGEPILLPPLGGDNGYMVLNQTAGTRSTELKVYDLPIRERNAQPRRLKMRAEMEGWTWFPPFHDPEKIALLTDAGMLGIFGIRQPGTTDQPLFPLLPEGGLRLSSQASDLTTAARATIVQIAGEDYWTLGLGRLQRHRLVWDTRQGPRLVPVWREAPLLGSPLHEGQTSANGTRLIVVTQAPRSSATWVSCVDEQRGEIIWKRQLGLVCQREPLAITLPEGPPLLLALDEGGTLFAIDPTRFKISPGTRWLLDSRMTPLAGPLEENRTVPPVLLRAKDGKSVYMVANPGAGKTLVIRHLTPAVTGRQLEMQERRVELRAPLAGPPALVGNYLVMPLADSDETLIRVALNHEEVQEGPNWRLSRSAPEAIGFVVPLNDQRFLTSDGGRGLTVWSWPANGGFESLPSGGNLPTLQLPARLTLPPLRLPGDSPRFLAADSAGLSLVEVEANGELKLTRRWDVAGIRAYSLHDTAEGVRVALQVGRTQLAWLDPRQSQLEWTHDRGEGRDLVGEPLLLDRQLLVADQSGRYTLLRLSDGQATGGGYELRGSIAPCTGPVPFGGDRLLCPLSDGTLIVLERKTLSRVSP